MRQIKEGNPWKLDLLLILSLFVLARICCPALSNIPIFSMAFTFMYGAAFVVLYLVNTKTITRQDFYLMAAAAGYTLYVVLRSFAAGYGLFERDAFNAYVIVFLTMIYIWVKEKPQATKVLLFKLIFACLIFDYVYSIIVLFFDPDASRTSAALSVLEASPYDVLHAVGSFDAVYGGLSVIVILLYMRQMMKERNVKNITTLLVLTLALVFIIMAAYGTALVLLVVALALFIAQKNKKLSVVLVTFLLTVLVLHEPFGQGIMNLSSHITYSDTLRQKMAEIGSMLKTFEATGTYAGEVGRAARMSWSWETFKQYPIFGGLGISGVTVGGHSEFLDLLGRFGLVGFAMGVTFFVCLYNNIRASLSIPKMEVCWKIILLLFVISAVLNPSLYALQMMPLILMLPLASSYMEFCENKKTLGEQL